MERFYIEQLKKLLTQMLADCDAVRNAAKRSLMNTLMITYDHGKIRFTAVSRKDGKRKLRYLDPDDSYIYRLANKAYTDELLRRLRHNNSVLASALNCMESTDFNDILQVLPKHFDLLEPQKIITPDKFEIHGFPNPSRNDYPKEARLTLGNLDPWEWAAVPYCENTDHLEYKIHPTSHGIKCRSKSESLLFEIYDSFGIPFHYDEVILIGGVRISPDFIGVRRDGTLIFHEHKGILTDEYRYQNDWKSDLYSSAGIIPGINLIYTYDSPAGTLNVDLARELIKDYYWL